MLTIVLMSSSAEQQKAVESKIFGCLDLKCVYIFKMECFLCDCIENVDMNICNVTTKYREIPLTLILHEFIGSDAEVAIENEEAICQTCKHMLDKLDLYRYKLSNIENCIAHKLHRKYKFDSELPTIRLDEETASIFVNGKNGQRFECLMCSFSTDLIDCLMPHNLMHRNYDTVDDTNIQDFMCNACQIMLPSEVLLNQHMHLFHAITAVECRDSVESEASVDLADKEENGETETMECIKCQLTFSNQRSQYTHYREVHCTCQICEKKCRTEETLRNHVKVRHTKHGCEICGKELGSYVSYQAHLKSHSDNHKFTCSYCHKGFRAKSLLATHIVIHTKESNFMCHICGQNFIHQRAHRLHIKWHQNPRPYQCNLCDKSYTHGSHLAIHRRTHSGELPKACQYCDKRFASASKLKAHLAIHTGVYLHPCTICGKGYNKRYKLAHHMLQAHEDDEMISNTPKCEYKLVIRPELEAIDE